MVRRGRVGSTEQGPACTLGEGQQETLCAAWLAEGMAPLGHLVPPSCRPVRSALGSLPGPFSPRQACAVVRSGPTVSLFFISWGFYLRVYHCPSLPLTPSSSISTVLSNFEFWGERFSVQDLTFPFLSEGPLYSCQFAHPASSNFWVPHVPPSAHTHKNKVPPHENTKFKCVDSK